ncbi:MAG: YbaN family protein [Rubrivivax sp.]|nr:YbaN family protein [Rubrivivax sp.]
MLRRASRTLSRTLSLVLWRTLALAALLLGLVGIFVPGLPTVPFLLVAAWAGGRGWPSLERWLLEHPKHGPAIRRWRDHRAVPRSAKWAATATMTLSTAVIALSPAPLSVKVGVPALMLAVGTWLWLRPER